MKRLSSFLCRIPEINHAIPIILEMIAMSYLVGAIEDGGLLTCLDLVPSTTDPLEIKTTFVVESDASPIRTSKVHARGLDDWVIVNHKD